MLLAAVSELKIALVGLLCFVALVAMVVYLPIAIIREVTQSEDEVLPEWMGSVRARRARLRFAILILGTMLAATIFAFAWVRG